MEDTSDDDHAVADNGKLLDRLFDAGLLPKYAFPTDVATFSVFEETTDPWNPKRRYSPQQGLNAALSQYRSEEHTSELQSLMHISYAVFCLKKTNKKKTLDKYIVDKTRTSEYTYNHQNLK